MAEMGVYFEIFGTKVKSEGITAKRLFQDECRKKLTAFIIL